MSSRFHQSTELDHYTVQVIIKRIDREQVIETDWNGRVKGGASQPKRVVTDEFAATTKGTSLDEAVLKARALLTVSRAVPGDREES